MSYDVGGQALLSFIMCGRWTISCVLSVLHFRCLRTHTGKDGMHEVSHSQPGTIDIGGGSILFLMVKVYILHCPPILLCSRSQ